MLSSILSLVAEARGQEHSKSSSFSLVLGQLSEAKGQEHCFCEQLSFVSGAREMRCGGRGLGVRL